MGFLLHQIPDELAAKQTTTKKLKAVKLEKDFLFNGNLANIYKA